MIRELLVSALGAFGGTAGFALMLSAPPRTVLPASLTSVVGYELFMILSNALGLSPMTAYFFASAVMSVLCEIEARCMRMPSTIFLLSALVPLVPGYSLYRAMLALVENDGAAAAAAGLAAVQGIAAIAVGAAVASVCFRIFAHKKRQVLV